MKKRISIAIIFLFPTVGILAQSSAMWQYGAYWQSDTNAISYYYWDNWKDVSYPKGNGNYICESNGRPLFHNGWVNLIFATDGTKIPKSDSLVPLVFDDCWYQRNDSVYDLIGFYDSTLDNRYIYLQHSWYGGCLFDSLNTFPSGLYRHTISKTKDGWVCTEKNKLLQKAGKSIFYDGKKIAPVIQIQNLRRYTDYSYALLIGNISNKEVLDIYKLENGDLVLTDSLKLGSSIALFREPLLVAPNSRIYSPLYFSYYDNPILNRSHTKIFFKAAAAVQVDTFNKRKIIARYNGFFAVDINPSTLKFSSSPKELWRFQENIDPLPNSSKESYSESINGLEISPNDSILYFNIDERKIDSIGGVLEEKIESKSYYWRYKEKPFAPEVIREKTSTAILNPYGKIYLNLGNTPYIVEETNNPNGTSTQLKQINVRNSAPGLRYYDYVRLDHSIDYSCNALVSFKNKSDLSKGMNSFTWYFTKEDGSIESVMGFEPTITYSKNGDYPFKCYGYSPDGIGYGEYYLDTLHIRIPPKPVAAFNASDTLVCAYKSLEFESTSFADSFHKSTPAKLLWTFGDGETTTMTTTDGSGKIFHTYKAPGTYTVSLFFSNGYCDSTLIKNQHIRVVDAPTPGFTIDYLKGCTPFVVNISDTNQVNMTKKEYYYSDIDSWINVSTSTFSHTFNSSGDFYIVQKLYGLTGCITQEDTAFVHVSPGISNVDSVHVINSTYLNNLSKFKSEPASIQIDWTTVPGTEKYLVYKAKQGQSRELLGETELNIWYDTLDKPQAVSYSILAQDSCGGRSASGRVGKPVFLQGEVIENNNTAILTFNGYEDWKTNAINYSISKVDSGSEVIFKTIGSPETVEDKTFAKENKLEQCYRITATGKGKTSYSNILCLPYKAIVLVPNAFSPNGDGLNDVFDVTTFGIESYSIMIYNRWGEQIFSGSNEGWTAESAMEGNYAYTIALKTADGKIILKSGMVSLLK